MSFELFKGKAIHRNPRPTSPSIMVYEVGRISFSKDCMAVIGEYVEIHYDRCANIVRFVASEKHSNAFKVSRSKNQRGVQGYINAQRFWKYAGNPSRGRYNATCADNFVEVDLRKGRDNGL